jgi:histidinol-phosphate aminotransferase
MQSSDAADANRLHRQSEQSDRTAFGAAEFSAFMKKVPGDVDCYGRGLSGVCRSHGFAESDGVVPRMQQFVDAADVFEVYGLAGLRIGYGVGHPTLVAEMNKLRTPFNVTSVGQAASLAALDDEEHVRKSVEINRAERKRLYEELKKLGLAPVASETNFCLCDWAARGRRFATSFCMRA